MKKDVSGRVYTSLGPWNPIKLFHVKLLYFLVLQIYGC